MGDNIIHDIVCTCARYVLQDVGSYVFYPVAYLIGVELDDCLEVARIISVKVFTTEIIAFQELGISAKAELMSVSTWLSVSKSTDAALACRFNVV